MTTVTEARPTFAPCPVRDVQRGDRILLTTSGGEVVAGTVDLVDPIFRGGGVRLVLLDGRERWMTVGSSVYRATSSAGASVLVPPGTCGGPSG